MRVHVATSHVLIDAWDVARCTRIRYVRMVRRSTSRTTRTMSEHARARNGEHGPKAGNAPGVT